MTTERPAPDPSAVEERRQKTRASGDRVRGDGIARWTNTRSGTSSKGGP